MFSWIISVYRYTCIKDGLLRSILLKWLNNEEPRRSKSFIILNACKNFNTFGTAFLLLLCDCSKVVQKHRDL